MTVYSFTKTFKSLDGCKGSYFEGYTLTIRPRLANFSP